MSSSEKYAQAGVASARQRKGVADAQFAGRLGGNQEFIADVNDEDAQSLLKKQPDAAPLTSITQSFDLRGFLVPNLWKMAFLEGWGKSQNVHASNELTIAGTFLLVFSLGAAATGLTAVDATPLAITWSAALINFLGLGIFTFCLGPVTGAHMNPTITMTTFFVGLTTLPRAILYIISQVVGAVIAGYWLRLGLGDEWYFPKATQGVIPGCTVDPNVVSPGQLFALELVFCQLLIFLAIGVGLDPRQGKVYGPAFGPVLVGITLGFGALTSSLVKPGYTGMSANPARCLGLMAAKNEFQYHYVHWLGPLTASILNGVIYVLVPPWEREEFFSFAKMRSAFSKSHTV
ncbi:hypothetical protein M409DRAFT_71658 [Zasmidium cellare ATCC 36951]|uniref:Aquaporin n=1 Tax=Zasmidium cellare ATCC 36951 TaxID=1080233 RepID=A0A6A6BV75_ZASCE|nr:uncharacterized protein M409DRAFT_71658 [Zasmidium cellare ATCC 36951]KAF2158423.1 hypothetical protein M409DRAFT_71658 [Zasmidium cellare ATCC 36951]